MCAGNTGCDEDNDDSSDNSNRSFDPFEFLIRPLMFSFSAVADSAFATLHLMLMLHLLHYIGLMLHLQAGTIWDLLRPTDSA